MTIVNTIQLIAAYLKAKLTEDKNTLQYKSTTVPSDFEVAIPDIYCFTMPSSTIIDSYPARCPAICITLDGRDNYNYTVSLHLCISSASKSSKEVAIPTDIPNIYEMGTSEEYDTNADDDLLIESILFTDQIYNYILQFTTFAVSDLSVEYPSVDLPDYPYAVSRVTFNVVVNQANIGGRPYDDFY